MNRKIITTKINEIKGVLNTRERFEDLSLMGGASGVILFYANVFQNTNDNIYLNKIQNLITNSVNDLNNGYNSSAFSYGIAGFTWTLEYLHSKELIDIKEIPFLENLDTYIYRSMIKNINTGDYDFLNSSGGIFWYFLNKKYINKEYITNYIDILYDKAKNIDSNKMAWIAVSESKESKKYNLSISHGLSSLIVLLTKVNTLDIHKRKTKELLEKSINFLYSQMHSNLNNRFLFPDYVDTDGVKSGGGRLAWCYGDLGVGISLWQAGEALCDENLKEIASDICLNTTKFKNHKDVGVFDAGLCHGTAGLAHIYNRMYRYTKKVEFQKATNYWIEETIKMAKFKDGLAGYKSYRNVESGGYKNDYGFLEGISGIGLSLLSSISDEEPTWDNCLLLS